MPVSVEKRSKKRKHESSSEENEVEKTTSHLKKEDYLIIIDWLKIERNYNACFGSGKAPPVGRPVKGKINGYEMMAINLRNQSPSKIDLTPRQMKDQFNTYKDKYKKTHTKSLSTGFGLTPEDRKAVIATIEDKLENMCPHYSAMNELMGHRAFVNPWYKADAQDDQESSESSGSESSDKSNEGSHLESDVCLESDRSAGGLGGRAGGSNIVSFSLIFHF